MTEATQSPVTASPSSLEKKATASTLSRLAKYTLVKILTLGVTIVIGVYLTIIIANMGGEVDNIRRGEIRERVALMVSMNQDLRRLPAEERAKYINDMVKIEEDRLGLDRPFILRSFTYLTDAMSLNLGRAQFLTSDSGSKQVRLIILERLPPTLVLFGTANILLFFFALFIALGLSRHYGSFLDRLVIALAPTSAAPGWFYGIFLILIFAAVLNVLPYGGMVDAPVPDTTIGYALSLLKHMILPTLAIFLSSIFITIYSWRTFFLIFSSEDYVEMAKAKGLSSQMIERRYILRPTMPNIITNFALLIIGLWFGAIILETVFNWPGLGRLFYRAIGLFDTPVIVGETVIYAYLLAITVFLLDFIYALVDPRVKVGGEGPKA
ncbi:ABC-type dipeptide/oligopeptide/nickel transport system, permease component [Bellilinea caldifistulae]|uniref:ABC transporter permease n=1 Tax=Bellilinea caldifistulae TaxID=360411 RepID=UPI0009E5DE2E|nr:ABC transporter permease [Bellilinea caldifistulae]GAP09316.1 ABC-type dipeptide/oligopeptide/nickel transport system, permease component [Bellilinea caldifistulae]